MLARSVFLDFRLRSIGVDVAATFAVPQFTHRVELRAWFFVLLVRIAFEIIGMAPGTVRFVRRGGPGAGFRIADVTAVAVVFRTVPAGISAGNVAVGYLRPPGGVVTRVAFLGGNEMTARLTGRRRAVVAG